MNAPLMSFASQPAEARMDALDIAFLDGNIAALELQEPVLQMLSDLIDYHQVRNRSHIERYGRPDAWSEEMLAQLHEAVEIAKEMIEQGEDYDIDLRIESTIKVTLEQH